MPSRIIRSAEANRKVWVYSAIVVVTLVILLATLAIAGRVQIFRCDRENGGNVNCVWKQSILGIITLNSKTTSGVNAISIGEQCAEANCKYRLEMYTPQGVIPVIDNYTSNYGQVLDTFTKFNTFFTDTSNSNMQIKEETRPILIIGLAVVCVLIWVYLGYLIWQVRHSRVEKAATQS